MKKIWILFCLSACGPVTTNTVIQHDVPVILPTAQPLTLNDIQWKILTVDQLKELTIKLQSAQQQNTLLFSLDAQSYTNLQLNLNEIQRYIQEQRTILDMAKQILSDRSGQIDQTNQTKPVK